MLKRTIAAVVALALFCAPPALAYEQTSTRPALVNVTTPPTAFPSTIAASGSWQSGAITTNGMRGLAAGVTSTQAGVLSIQRYLDAAGTIAIGAPISQAITASTPATVAVNDGVPAAAFQVTVTNSSGSTATITNPAIIMTGL